MVKDVMETKVLLRLIRDDIKILENINNSFLSQTNLTCEEAEVALARARALVMEFEMLSKNLSKEEEPRLFGEAKVDKQEEENEKKVHSLRNFLPFIKSEEKSAPPATNHLGQMKEEAARAEEVLDEPDTIREDFAAKELVKDTPPDSLIRAETNGKAVDSIPVSTESIVAESPETAENSGAAAAVESSAEPQAEEKSGSDVLSESAGEEKKTLGEMLGEKQQLVNDLLSQDRTEVKFESKPLKSIRDGIGINDRFLFIRELFYRNSEKYEQTLTALDEFTGIEDAVKFLKQNFKWSKSEAGEKFLLLIKRRFAK